jgi:hypothetical protein
VFGGCGNGGPIRGRRVGVGFWKRFHMQKDGRHEHTGRLEDDCVQITRRSARHSFMIGSGLRKHHVWPNKWNAFYCYRISFHR